MNSMCVQKCIPRWHIYHRELVLGGDDKHLPLVHPIERQHVISTIPSNSPTGLLLLAPEALWKTFPVGLDCTGYGNADLVKFNRKKGTVIKPVDVQVVTLVVHPLCKGHHNTTCVWELRSVDQLRFLAVVDADLVYVPGLGICQCKSLYSPGIRLPFEILEKADSSTEADDRPSSAICWPGVYAVSIVGRSLSSSGWIFDLLVVPSRLPTWRAPKIWKNRSREKTDLKNGRLVV